MSWDITPELVAKRIEPLVSDGKIRDEALRFPEIVRFPDASVLNFEIPPTWKSARFPVNPEVEFIANCVPVAEPLNSDGPPVNPPSPTETIPSVVVANTGVMNFWSPVHEFAFARSSDIVPDVIIGFGVAVSPRPAVIEVTVPLPAEDQTGEPPPEEVIDFIHLFKRNYGYNEVDIQNMNSSYCGYFCIALILLTQKRGNLFDKSNEFINMFSRNTKMNDDILRQYFKPYKKNKIISRLYR